MILNFSVRQFTRFAPPFFLLGGTFCVNPVWAQTTGGKSEMKESDGASSPSSRRPVVVPPSIKKDLGAEYPAQAINEKVRETVKVALVLDISAEGKVVKAVVESPKGHGFDEAAIHAANQMEWEPATKDGVSVAARVIHVYEFAPPPSTVKGRVFSRDTGAPIAGAKIQFRWASDAFTLNPTAPLATTEAQESVSDEQGRFAFQKLKPGKFKLTITESSHLPSSTYEGDIGPAEVIELTERLEPALSNTEAVKSDQASAASDVFQVEVKAKKPPREVTKQTLEQRELTRIPGSNGDALKALLNLPGLARPPGGFSGLLIVRGSAPTDTNVFVDGTLVPLIYHFGGLSSVIPTEMLEKIDFYPGNFSAQYGRVMGGIVDVGVRDPKKDKKLHGLVQIDLIDARFLAEGPIFDTGWNFAIAGRRSWFDLWLKPVLEGSGTGVTTAPVYYDYQAIVAKDLDKRQSLRFMFFGSDDRLSVLTRTAGGSDPTLDGSLSLGTSFFSFQARYKNKVSPDAELKVVASVGKQAIDFNFGENYFLFKSYPIATRVEWSQKIAKGIATNVGLDFHYQPYDVSIRFPPPPPPGEPPTPFLSRSARTVNETTSFFLPAVYNEWELTPWKGGRLVTGVRVDYTGETKSWEVSPRLVVRQDLNKSDEWRTTLKLGLGVFRQPPQPQEVNSTFGQVGLSNNRSIHYSLGIEREITKQIDLSVEGYYKDLDNLVVVGRGNAGRGKSFGIEALLRYKPDNRFFGFIAYTLSRSTRQNSEADEEKLFRYDQTHILTVLGSYRLGNGWEIGARFRFVSGSLTTPRQYGFFDENSGSYTPISYPQFGERIAPYHQLDLRVDKTWNFRNFKLGVYLDILNAYNARNVEGVSYNYNSTLRTDGFTLPILPSIGIKGEL